MCTHCGRGNLICHKLYVYLTTFSSLFFGTKRLVIYSLSRSPCPSVILGHCLSARLLVCIPMFVPVSVSLPVPACFAACLFVPAPLVISHSRPRLSHTGSGLDFPINTFSCTVGLKLSQANYYIKSSLAAAALCKEVRSEFACDSVMYLTCLCI